jgi:hypothetical protein
MSDNTLATLVTALDIAAFERGAEGGFQSLAPPPAWFTRLPRDGTFPFLGHILEEAQGFWNSGANGVREWGPCADVDENGQEFHYRVKALRVDTRAYLVFQIDEGAERLRRVLQRVRSDALMEEQNPPQS